MSLVFPDLISFNDFGGDFPSYFKTIYSVFYQDFIVSQPVFEGLEVSVRKYPEVDGMHRTFYHITHEGEDENNRQPDLRRMERIRFPKFVIGNFKHEEILIWKNRRGKDERIVLFNEAENYIVILTERKDYYLFITAYFIEKEHRKKKLLKEYEAYIKTKTA
ncbi:hypothetical protein [Pedobacter glucosidilyticus]|uniref:hypothetical protein n=1 Tax=Pedobacter glucosidilyticus TaxID=1122941 RepID=UPI00040929C4|nr:hypothetical protein [Pedobacter glucosidilyticus]